MKPKTEIPWRRRQQEQLSVQRYQSLLTQYVDLQKDWAEKPLPAGTWSTATTSIGEPHWATSQDGFFSHV